MFSNTDEIISTLTEQGTLDQATIEMAGQHQQSGAGESLLEALVRINRVTEEDASRAAAVSWGMEFEDLNYYNINLDLLGDEMVNGGIFDPHACVRYSMVPIDFDGSNLKIAIADPTNMEALDDLRHVITQYPPDFVCSPREQIHELIRTHLAHHLNEEEMAKIGGGPTKMTVGGGIPGEEDGPKGEGDDAPVIGLVTDILSDAYDSKASDIHIEPLEKVVRLRNRIDGALHHIKDFETKLLPAIISRIKIMTGSMSIAEKRIPQDGRIQAQMGHGKELDLRVSTVPTSHGESVVMRLLDKSSLLLGLPQLGFYTDDHENFNRLIRLPDGILLVTGPTGSGKTTTLYACLNEINKPDRKIITVEDPVEYSLAGINQVMVKDSIGMTFHAALRSILRQAPNIIMIGEIRDLETATIAINASLTGHLVFSTLHTNDAPSAVARLEDIGVKRFLVSSAVRAIMAQRLVRKLCETCKTPGELSETEIRRLNLDAQQAMNAEVFTHHGCNKCRNTGYKGRMGIFEIFNINEESSRLINDGLSTPQLRKRARELGMRTLREDGVRKVLAGDTTASEVVRVTMADAS